MKYRPLLIIILLATIMLNGCFAWNDRKLRVECEKHAQVIILDRQLWDQYILDVKTAYPDRPFRFALMDGYDIETRKERKDRVFIQILKRNDKYRLNIPFAIFFSVHVTYNSFEATHGSNCIGAFPQMYLRKDKQF